MSIKSFKLENGVKVDAHDLESEQRGAGHAVTPAVLAQLSQAVSLKRIADLLEKMGDEPTSSDDVPGGRGE